MSPEHTGPPGTEGPELDPVLHHPTRLAVAAFLSACEEAEFRTVREHCRVSDSVLSKTASALESAGYLDVRKGAVGRRHRTWLSLTDEGHDVLDAHLTALQNIAAAAREAGSRAGGGT
ncbi:transcriptional regulator [Streptomyces sp. ODS28]|uniref:transcriptional regulator n=1 Tax=Streptomyces sp. ODS28 TaxID=3136688 RepID=UPI0031EBA42C